jgi:hypothetical protein
VVVPTLVLELSLSIWQMLLHLSIKRKFISLNFHLNYFPNILRFNHGFKNQTEKRTEKGSGSRITGRTGVGPVVEPVTS